MRLIKFSASLIFTLVLIFVLNNRWVVGGLGVPPMGRFLDPFHGFWNNAAPANSDDFALKIDGISRPISISFDSLSIPHIFAENDEDLYFAQGYITARHRLWQMEFQTHAAAGRISEILGAGPNNAILDYDRNQRRLGMTFGAMHALEVAKQNEAMMKVIEAYTAGVNAYIASLDYEDLPFEYKLLDYAPEPWTPLKCVLLMKSMAQTLNMSDKDVQMTNALKLFGKDMVALLYPDREQVGDAIVEKTGQWNFQAPSMDSIPPALPDELIAISGLAVADPNIGSNNWAVSGTRTATGAPILCNDPHLDLTLPSIWYVAHLSAPGVNAMGATLPGAPCVVIGFNDSIAWGVTNAQRDLVDWYAIEFNADKSKYKLDDQWVDTRIVIENLKVRDRADFTDSVMYTHWGPVPYDNHFRAESARKHFAFRWIAHDGSEELLTFYQLNRASNHADYMAALDHFSSPAQNFAFASVSGDIAMRIQGKFPVRRPLEGKFVIDGTRSSNGWQAFIPTRENVMYKNPPRGFVSSANQYPADSTYPYYITASSYEAYRNRRINDVLRADSSVTVEDMMALQNDTYNLKASENLAMLLTALDPATMSESEKKASDVLRGWDFQNSIQSEAAVYFEAWLSNLYPLIWDEIYDAKVPLSRPTAYQTFHLIATNPTLSFFDVASTAEKETAGDVIRMAFRKGVADVEEWRSEHGAELQWADYKDTYVEHLARQEALSRHVEHGGNYDNVDASGHRHGPSWRMIVSLEPGGIVAYGVYPGGQDGNIGSPHYDDLLDDWAAGRYFRLSFTTQPADPSTSITITLNPAAK